MSQLKEELEDEKLPRVLLAVRIIDSEDNDEALKRWIREAPLGLVKFEKRYRSFSELLLVELPLPMWDLIPRNPAVTFIGFTKGEMPIVPSKPDSDLNFAPSKLDAAVQTSVQVVPQQNSPDSKGNAPTSIIVTTNRTRRELVKSTIHITTAFGEAIQGSSSTGQRAMPPRPVGFVICFSASWPSLTNATPSPQQVIQ